MGNEINTEIKTVLIGGYGLMGRGIALSFARGGHATGVLSRDPSNAVDIPEGVSVVAELPSAARRRQIAPHPCHRSGTVTDPRRIG
jgi:prephenate dehydrogenase